MPKRLKVLHVINSMANGGAETLVANSLAPGGLCEYADNTLVYFQGGSYLLGILDKKVRTVCLEYKGGLEVVSLLVKLRKIIIEGKFDIVHSNLNPAGLYIHL